ncbi:MAG: HigA family addiction module antitoxin [Mariprofundaceae bacterium]|nr:HigA family addiction module antitoxin [Mariprofundaceae bacterium]
MTRIPSHREPTHPGEMLREEFLIPMNISQRDLANAIHVPYQRVNELVNKKRGITPSTALRLAKFFGMSADFWLNVQMRWELFKAQSTESRELDLIQDYHKVQRVA